MQKRFAGSFLALFFAAILLSACGNAGYQSAYVSGEKGAKEASGVAVEPAEDSTEENSTAGEQTGEGGFEEEEKNALQESVPGAGALNEIPKDTSYSVSDGEKKIRTVNLSLELKSMEKVQKQIREQVKTEGGYIESEEFNAKTGYGDSDYLHLSVRIPKDKVDHFLEFLSGEGRILSKSESLEDVRLQYHDAESHIKALEKEQERVLALMDKAENVDQLIALESRLTDIRYQLEYYHTEINDYDNKVDYSTVNLDLLERGSESLGEGQYSFSERVRDGFVQNIHGILYFFMNAVFFILVYMPQIILGIGFVLVLILWHKMRKKKKADRENKEEKENKEHKENKETKENKES
nr:DUF4349 domain-containing protein [uncultured Oribacterium sp.]